MPSATLSRKLCHISPLSRPFPSQWSNMFSSLSCDVVDFYPRDAMLARSLRQRRVCLSVRPDVCLSHAGIVPIAERNEDREMYTV